MAPSTFTLFFLTCSGLFYKDLTCAIAVLLKDILPGSFGGAS